MHRSYRIFVTHASNYLTDHAAHGDGLLAFEFVRRLAERGHEIHVATAGSSIERPLPPNLHLHDAGPWSPFSTVNPLENALRIRSVLDRLSRPLRFDVLHQLNPVEAARSSLVCGRNIPLVLGPFLPSFPEQTAAGTSRSTALGMLGRSLLPPLINRLDRRQQSCAAALLLSSRAAVSALYEPLAVRGRTHILPYGVDVAHFRPESVPDRSRPPTILYLANLVPRKGILTLLDAFEIVHQALPSVRLRIGGSGPAENAMHHRLATMRCRSAVEVLGAVPRDRVAHEMRRCDIYCLPARWESFGVSLVEAMACGKPIVTTCEGGPVFVVPDSGGIHLPPGDSRAVANALIRLLGDPAARKSMGMHNRMVAEQDYDWNLIIDRLEGIYDEVIS